MEQVLKYKFWILSGLVLPLALVGFFLANGAMQAATEERVSQLKGIQPPNPNQPNDTFTEKARKEADALAQANATQLKRLDKIQRSWMTWPREIEGGLERKPDTGEIIYRADIKSDYRVRYPAEYEKQVREVWLKLNPVIPSGLPYTSRNLVFCEPSVLPMHPFPPGRVPSSQAIWDAQEDLWILSMLIEAINRTNAVAQFNVSDAAIREIRYLELFGGTGESTVLAGPAAGAPDAEYTPEYMGTGEQGGPQGAGLQVAFADGQAGFDPQEEYGSQAGAAAAGSPEASYMGAETGLFGGAMEAKPLRYIGFDESNPGPYRRRGFYISMLILERKIPDFVTNLANLDPPILAGRWGFANNPYDEDHLLRAAARPGMGGLQGPGGSYDYEMSAPGISRGPRRPTRPAIGGNPYGGEYNPMGGGPTPLLNPRDPLAMITPKMRAEVEALRPALLGKDLVQLDLTGVVTIFTPEVPPETSTPEEEEAQLPSTPPATVPPGDAAPATTPEPTPPAATDPSAAPPPAEPSSTNPPAPAPASEPPATDPTAAPPNETASPPPASPAPSQ